MSIAGVRDFLPEDKLLLDWLFNKWDCASKAYNFKKYDVPIVEDTSLYTRKGGDDIIKEMFTLIIEGKSCCLRPEVTPSLTRIINKMNPKKYPYPLYLTSICQCWRFETVSLCRKREHYQYNCDIVSLQGNDIKHDAEILAMLVSFFTSIGLTNKDVVIKISNHQILTKVINELGKNYCVENILNIVDKLGKISEDEIKKRMIEEGMTCDEITHILSLIEANDVQNIFPNYIEFKRYLDAYEITDWIMFDLTVVRGLSYYTGIIFEAFAKNSKVTRSICGGGRYDDLYSKYYSDKKNIVGFGMGDVVILELLKERKLLPIFGSKLEYLIIVCSTVESYYETAIKISSKIRNYHSCQVYQTKKISDGYSYGNRCCAKFVIIIADREIGNNSISLKNMETGDQIEINVDDFFNNFKKSL